MCPIEPHQRRFRRRHYEAPDEPIHEPASLPELGRRVFLVLLRAVGKEHASLAEVGKDQAT